MQIHNDTNRIKIALNKEKEFLRKTYKIKEIAVFGSYARNDEGRKSDVDILVDFDEVPSLLTFINLERYLKELLGKKVDLVRKAALRKEIREEVLSEAIYI